MLAKYPHRHALVRCVVVWISFWGLTGWSAGADRYWVGPSTGSGNWSDPLNWSATLNGAGGAGVPEVGDTAIIDVPSSRNITFDHVYDAPGVAVSLLPRPATPPTFNTAINITQTSPASRLFVSGDLILPVNEAFGGAGTVQFTQQAGAVQVDGWLGVRGRPAMRQSFYTLAGGELITNAASMSGRFHQTGGKFITGELHFFELDFDGVFSGGTLEVQDLLQITFARPFFSGADVTASTLRATTSNFSATTVHMSAGTASIGTIDWRGGNWSHTGGALMFTHGRFDRGGINLSAGSISADTLVVERTDQIYAGGISQSGGELSVVHLQVVDGAIGFHGGSFSVGTLAMTGGRFVIGAGGDKVLRTRALEVTGNAQMNIIDNAVIVDYTGGSPIHSIRAQIGSAHANGVWDGAGIRSSLANATTRGVAYAEASALGSIPPIFGPVDDDTILIFLARYGDADLNGIVNLTDFNRLAGNFGGSSKVWTQADFNYDGVVNLADFNLLAANFGLSAGPDGPTPDDWSTLASAVPEPSLLSFTGVAALAAMVRRPPRRPKAPRHTLSTC